MPRTLRQPPDFPGLTSLVLQGPRAVPESPSEDTHNSDRPFYWKETSEPSLAMGLGTCLTAETCLSAEPQRHQARFAASCGGDAGGFPRNNWPIPVVRTWSLKLSYSRTPRKTGLFISPIMKHGRRRWLLEGRFITRGDADCGRSFPDASLGFSIILQVTLGRISLLCVGETLPGHRQDGVMEGLRGRPGGPCAGGRSSGFKPPWPLTLSLHSQCPDAGRGRDASRGHCRTQA